MNHLHCQASGSSIRTPDAHPNLPVNLISSIEKKKKQGKFLKYIPKFYLKKILYYFPRPTITHVRLYYTLVQ
jgi:hypothetical protein